MKCNWLIVGFLAIGLGVANPAAHAADSESNGAAAEQSGRYREALNLYIVALQNAPEGSVNEQALREKIISVAHKLKPAAVVPEEAQRYLGRGQAAVEIAKTSDDFLAAIYEFKKAARLAPWLARIYFNLAVVQEKTGQFNEAMRNFKLYLLAAPAAADAQDVKTRIYGLELKAERQRNEEREKAANVERERQKKDALDSFKRVVQGGTYDVWLCNWFNPFKPGHDGEKGGCNENESRGSNWYKWSGPDATHAYYEFFFTSEGKVVLCGRAGDISGGSYPPCPSGFGPIEIIGTVEDSDIHSIRWADNKGKPAWVWFNNDGKGFKISYDRPADDSGYDAAYRYGYWSYRRR